MRVALIVIFVGLSLAIMGIGMLRIIDGELGHVFPWSLLALGGVILGITVYGAVTPDTKP